jgi:hypothetical protein
VTFGRIRFWDPVAGKMRPSRISQAGQHRACDCLLSSQHRVVRAEYGTDAIGFLLGEVQAPLPWRVVDTYENRLAGRWSLQVSGMV